MRSRSFHFILVLLVCVAVYWPLLGVPGFGSSEGHRVGPAWEMLDSGDWIHLKLFGLTYLRKPPGMPWAIAASSMLFGETEFAARAVSTLASTIMALVAFWFAGRWLGRPWGLAAGLAQALSPVFLTIGRTAEIDPLNALGTQLAAFAMISVLRKARAPASAPLLPGAPLLLGAGIIIATIVKGPASLPVFLGIVIAACIQERSLVPLRDRRLWVPMLVAALLLGAFTYWFASANSNGQAVTQDFSEFTWSISRLKGTALLVPSSFVAAFPTSLALIVLLLYRRRPPDDHDAGQLRLGVLLGRSWLFSLVTLMLIGSSNPRYAMPAGVLLAPLAAWAIQVCWQERKRSVLARLGMLGHPIVPLAILLIGAFIWMGLDIQRKRHQEGPDAGAAIAALLPDGADVWANDLIEARPDALLYARAAAARAGKAIHPHWEKKAILAGDIPAGRAGHSVFLLLRDDAESGEAARYQPKVARSELVKVAEGNIAKYRWVAFRVPDARLGH